MNHQEITSIVVEVAAEITALSERTTLISDSEIQLDKGYSITMNAGGAADGHAFEFSRNDGRGRTSVIIGAGNAGTTPAVLDPRFPGHVTHWTPGDGEQPDWMRRTLRTQAAEFLLESAGEPTTMSADGGTETDEVNIGDPEKGQSAKKQEREGTLRLYTGPQNFYSRPTPQYRG